MECLNDKEVNDRSRESFNHTLSSSRAKNSFFFVIKELFFLKCDKSQIIECHQRFKYHVTKIEFYWKAIYKAK